MQNYLVSCCLASVLALCCAGTALAHRVNVFAYVDGDALLVECYFSKKQPVRHGRLTFRDGETGSTLHEGTTDAQGRYRFCPDRDFLATGHGIHIVLDAGEGHQSSWQVEPEELQALVLSPTLAPTLTGPDTAADTATDAATATAAALTPEAASIHTAPAAVVAVDRRELEALLVRVMDARLAPIRQALARQEQGTPDLQDIIGGIGWIVGLLGLVTYLRYRPRAS